MLFLQFLSHDKTLVFKLKNLESDQFRKSQVRHLMPDCYGRHFTLDLIDIDHIEKNVNSLV